MVFAINWRESAMDLHVFPIPVPPPASLPIPSLWVFPVHQPQALVSCIQPGLVICFTLDSILVSMLFSLNIPPSPSPTESRSLLCTSFRPFQKPRASSEWEGATQGSLQRRHAAWLAFSRLLLAAVLSMVQYASVCRHCTKQRCIYFLKVVKEEKGGRRGRGQRERGAGGRRRGEGGGRGVGGGRGRAFPWKTAAQDT